jgi:restriction system protein
MPIPIHDEIRVPALELLKNKDIIKLKDFEQPLSKVFNLTHDELIKMYSSGNGPVFYDRISWALSYLNMAGLVQKPRRGYYQITDKGIELLSTPERVNDYVAEQTKNRPQSQSSQTNNTLSEEDIQELTPHEKIYRAFEDIKASTYNDIIDTILSKTPREFEKLVVTLLQKMGYGGEIENSGAVTQYSNDKGIDGIIKEDVLGFGRIHIQAKRYKRDNKIGREDLNKFVGALAGTQSNKGVFITTSSFNKNALEYANSLTGITLVLIDGGKLAKYIYEYSLGMQTEQLIEIKKLDSDYWDIMEDDTTIKDEI